MSTAVEPATRTGSRRAALSPGQLARRDRVGSILAIAAPALLALGLCVYQLTTRSLWLDESATFSIASQHGGAFGAGLARDGGNMLAYYALLHLLIGWFGSGALVLRLPAAIAAAATVALVSALGLRLAGRRVAFIAGLLTAVSLSLVYWGQNARGYTPMIALIVASYLAFSALLERRGGRAAWIAYVVLTTAAVYVGLEAALVVPAQLVTLVWFRDRWRAVVSGAVVSGLCCIPLAVLAAERGAGQLFWVPKPSFQVLKQIVQALTSSALQPSFYTSTTTALAVLTLVVLAWGALRALRLSRASSGSERAGRGPWAPGLMFSWLLVPAVVALIESALGQSIFQARYLLVSLPAVSLLAALALAERPMMIGGRFRWAASIGIFAVLITLRALQLAPAYGVSPENWRSASSYLVTHTQPTDCAAFYPLDARMPVRYYLRDYARAPRPILPTLPWAKVRPFVEEYASLSPAQVARLPGRCGRVWLITRRGGGVGGTTTSRANSIRFRQLSGALAREYPVSHTAYFGQAGLVSVTLYSR